MRKFIYKGKKLYCPLCGDTYRKFMSFGVIARPNAMCPKCGSLERHRLLWLVLEKLWDYGLIKREGRMLHVAPEGALTDKFINIYDYLSVDIDMAVAMKRMDITTIDFPENHFDAIVCNHVLEHIPDDRKALSELFRVLKPGGWACIQVPMIGDETIEGADIKDPSFRESLFGQIDHVRQYGRDFIDRLIEAGFDVRLYNKAEMNDSQMLKRISVECENEVIISWKL